MTRPRTSVTIRALGLTILIAACDGQTDGGRGPSSPTLATRLGEITVRSLTPASPAQIPIRECEYGPSSWEICTNELQMVFEVQSAKQTPSAMVTADFYAGSKLCGSGGSAQQPLAAGERAAFSVSFLSLSSDGGPSRCPLPVVTTRMVVWLREITSPPARDPALLTQEFVNTYTFVEP